MPAARRQTLPRLAAASVVAALVGALTGLGPGLGGAAEAASPGVCPAGGGVTVAVEPARLGGAPEVTCVHPDPGDTGADLFAKAGHVFTRVSSMPDVVCRIDNRPADAGCGQMPPANAYWSLWVADINGPWTYATQNVNELAVTSGGGVAFRWVDGNVSRAPATVLADAVGAPASPSPVSSPAASPATTEPSTPASHGPVHGPSALPGWVAPALVVLLAGAAVVLWRRRA